MLTSWQKRVLIGLPDAGAAVPSLGFLEPVTSMARALVFFSSLSREGANCLPLHCEDELHEASSLAMAERSPVPPCVNSLGKATAGEVRDKYCYFRFSPSLGSNEV